MRYTLSLKHLTTFMCLVALSGPVRAQDKAPNTKLPVAGEPDFRKKLSSLLSRLESSIELIKNQIAVNQSAPFLADLYLQYAELLSQKANALYYVEMEKLPQNASASAISSKKFNSVISTQKESLGVLRTLLRDFPNFNKRAKTLMLLALNLKSIDESAEFASVAAQLMQKYPGSEEDIKVRLYLGQDLFEKGDFKKSKEIFEGVINSKYVYEKNLARYRKSLILIRENKGAEALSLLSTLILDPELTNLANPQEVSLESRGLKQDLKREALMETLVPYTKVHKKDSEEAPLKFYSAIAPSEALFQEVIEKLAFRYVFLKDYQKAIRLLRVLAERISDSQKVLDIYREVLSSIPEKKRTDVAPEELEYVLKLFHRWRIVTATPKKVRKDALYFFEEQVRDLATQSHDLADKGTDKKIYLVRAQALYQLYLGSFQGSPYASKMALNLADVFFQQELFLESGETYLRIMRGVFGPPPTKAIVLLKNVVVTLQKEKSDSFYRQIRLKGLLIASIETLFKFSPTDAKNPDFIFTLNKARSEQGFFEESTRGFYALIARYPSHPRAVDSANILLDYYNIRSDYEGLEKALKKLISMKIRNPAFAQKLVQMQRQAQSQQLDKMVKSSDDFNDFSQAKSYFDAALKLDDPTQKNVALGKALAKARSEKDDATFFSALKGLKASEKDPAKRKEMDDLEQRERMRMGQFYSIMANKSASQSDKVDMGILLKYWTLFSRLVGGTKVDKQKMSSIYSALESPIAKASRNTLLSLTLSAPQSPERLLALFKNQESLPEDQKSSVLSQARSQCQSSKASNLCRWQSLQSVEAERTALQNRMQSEAGTTEQLQALGPVFESVSNKYKGLQGSGDAHLEISLDLSQAQLYANFSDYLAKAGQKNADLKALLEAKATETKKIATSFYDHCGQIIESALVWTPVNRACFEKRSNFKLSEAFRMSSRASFVAPGRDPSIDEEARNVQKAVFADPADMGSLEKLAEGFYESQDYSHAAALATLALSLGGGDKDKFEALLGCSLIPMGLLNEAGSVLNKGEAPLKTQCRDTLKKMLRSGA